MTRPQTLTRPLSIDRIQDGGCYRLAAGTPATNNLFFDIARVDGVFVKLPSTTGRADFASYITHARSSAEDVRPLEPAEQLDRLNLTAAHYPAFGSILARHVDLAHMLVVFKLQYDRIRENSAVAVPDTRFALLTSGRLLLSQRVAVFQERIQGTTLWEMFDFDAELVRSEWEPHLRSISAQLTPVVDSPLASHIDWNIQNFVFRPADSRLFYVDVKPTLLVGRTANERNRRGVRDYFIQ